MASLTKLPQYDHPHLFPVRYCLAPPPSLHHCCLHPSSSRSLWMRLHLSSKRWCRRLDSRQHFHQCSFSLSYMLVSPSSVWSVFRGRCLQLSWPAFFPSRPISHNCALLSSFLSYAPSAAAGYPEHCVYSEVSAKPCELEHLSTTILTEFRTSLRDPCRIPVLF